jgi:hypothetical protein
MLLAYVLIGLAFCGKAADSQVPLSVCDLIVRRTELSGRMVTVRGAVAVGGHGVWLAASRDCAYKLMTRGVVWPNIVYLTYPDNQSRNPSDHAGFKVDWRAVHRADNEAVKGGYDPKANHEVATYTGLFETYQDLDNRVTPNIPGAVRLGFGPLLGAPAELLIKSVKDVVIVWDSQTNRDP